MFCLARPVKYLEGLCKCFLARPKSRFAKHGRSPKTMFKKQFQVSIMGGTSPVAQSLSLLLTHHPLISRLVVYDLQKATYGLGLDLSHIPSQVLVEGRAGHIGPALRGSDIVVLAGGVPKTTGQTDYDLFKMNADFIFQSVQEICKHCPDAFVVNLTEPINYTVPLASLVLEAGNAYNNAKVFGVTGEDIMRAHACLDLLFDLPKNRLVDVPVICGHSAKTAVPLLSHVTPWFSVDACTAVTITEHIRGAEDHIVTLKRGSGQSSHISAYAGFNTIATLLSALSGSCEKHVAFVANNEYRTKYFAGPVKITKDGISELAQYKLISSIEAAYLQDAVNILAREVSDAEAYYRSVIAGRGLYNIE